MEIAEAAIKNANRPDRVRLRTMIGLSDGRVNAQPLTEVRKSKEKSTLTGTCSDTSDLPLCPHGIGGPWQIAPTRTLKLSDGLDCCSNWRSLLRGGGRQAFLKRTHVNMSSTHLEFGREADVVQSSLEKANVTSRMELSSSVSDEFGRLGQWIRASPLV